MKEYLLFLDETKPHIKSDIFCLAGIVMSKSDYDNVLVPKINDIKQRVFNDTDVVLHLFDLKKNNPPFNLFKTAEDKNKFFQMVCTALQPLDFTVLASCVNDKSYKRLYQHSKNDNYFVALQILLENYVHFLLKSGGTGSVYMESRNKTDDDSFRKHYFRLILNGTLFVDRKAMEKRLFDISFPLKSDNVIGLQIADFVPNSISKIMLSGSDFYGLGNLFKSKLYSGNYTDENRFGFKNLF